MEVNKTYSNRLEINSSVYDFLFTFYLSAPVKNEKGQIISEEKANKTEVYMSPQHTKSFLNSLKGQVEWYENTFGEIRLIPLEDNK